MASDTSGSQADARSQARQRLINERLRGLRPHDAQGTVIKARHHNGLAPTSFAQERFWFLHQLRPDSPLYNLPLALRLRGEIDLAALEHALYALAERHEVLRTSYMAPDGRPVQVISDKPRHTSLAPTDVPEAELITAVSSHMALPFDLERGPLVHARLFRITPVDHVLALAVHHSVGDLITIDLLGRELTEFYAARVENREPALPVLAIQYADYAAWQREEAASPRMAAKIEEWRERLGDLTPLRMPSDRPSTSLRARQSTFFDVPLPQATVHGLRELIRGQDRTLYMVGLTALEALLWRYTGRNSFAVGTPAAGRTQPELENLVGCFINMLTLRADVRREGSFLDLLRQTQERLLEALADQDLPFERLVAELNPDRHTTDNPFTTVGFGVLPEEPTRWRMGGLEAESFLPPPQGLATFDLAAILAPIADEIICRWIYAPELFDEETVRRWAADYQRVLTAAAPDPAVTIGELCRLSREQRRAVLDDRNDTATEFPDLRIEELFERRAAAQPDAAAVRHGDTSLTYRELDRAANRLAHVLSAMGVGAEARVAIYLDRSAEMIVALLGVLKAGAAYVPIDRGQPSARIKLFLENSEASLLISRTELLTELGTVEARLLLLDQMGETLAESRADRPPTKEPRTDTLAYVIYTSGSTGLPKGIAVEHRPVANVIEWVNTTFAVGTADRLLFVTRTGFDLSVYDIFGVLTAGGCVVVVGEDDLGEPQRLMRLLAAERITIWDSAPAAILPLLAFGESEGFTAAPLRLVLVSGDWVPVALPDRLHRGFPSARLIALGGATEATIWSNWFDADSMAPEWVSVPYGWPIQNARYYVLDEGLEPVPVRVPGELYIGGAVLARGYQGNPALTAERFLPDPYGTVPGARMYRTGDRVRLFPDGTMEFLGRVDDQVKIRGFRIEPAEIEAVLSAHPEVRDCVVAARQLGTGDQSLVGYVTAARASLSSEELRSFAAERLPRYMVPSRFVTLDALPLTANGKCDRGALPDPWEMHGEPVEEPVTPTERTLVQLWAELLDLKSPIGRDDNFFELGGHSLLAVRLVLIARRRFGVDLLVADLLANPTLRHFAATIDDGASLASSRNSVLIRLKDGDDTVPVILLPAPGGSVDSYMGLLARLGDRAVYTFDPRPVGVEGLAGAAGAYLAELRAQGLIPPFVLCGWSIGGALALELAQQLWDTDDETPNVVMMDPAGPMPLPPGHVGPPPELSDADLIKAFGRELAAPTAHAVTMPEFADKTDLDAALRTLARALADFGHELRLSDAELHARYATFRANMTALTRYMARLAAHGSEDASWLDPYPGDVTLIVPDGDVLGGGPWQDLCANLRVQRLPGDSFDLLTAANAGEVADSLERAARDLQETGSEHGAQFG